MATILKKHETQSMIAFKSLFRSKSYVFLNHFILPFVSRVRNQSDARRQRLQEAATVHQFIRDLEDEEAQIRYIALFYPIHIIASFFC